MILLALVLAFSSSEDRIQMRSSTPSMVDFSIEFSEYKRNEQIATARLVISEDRPTIEYQLAEIDSSVAGGGLETEPVNIGDPVVIEGVKLYPVLIEPSFTRSDVTHYVRSADIKIHFSAQTRALNLSPSMSKVFEHLILNFRSNGDQRPRGYLIITPSDFIDELQPLVRWKEKKGWYVEIRTTSQTGSTPTLIKDYIANAYNTWSPRPEYVLLVGDVNHVPTFNTPSATDHPYTLIDGSDFLSELLIGRLSVSNENELNTIVAKIVGYERNPTMSDPSWYSRALMVGANLPSGMTTPVPTKRWVREKFLDYGFNAVDTVYDPMPPSAITTSVNTGVLFVNYRSGDGDQDGWPFPLFKTPEVYALTNGWKLPIVTSIVCWTGNYGASTCFGEAWLRTGNPVTPKGAVAFIGASSPQSHSRWNNCLDYGIYWAILKEHIYSLGAALYRGKMELFLNFPVDTTITSGSSFYFHVFNLLGDPSLEVWTGIPDSFIVTHALSTPTGANSFPVHVCNAASQPVAGAMVSLYKAGEVKEVEFTDAFGNVDFNFITSTDDTLFVTITKHNFKPYAGYTLVSNSSVYIGHFTHNISDPTGNGNGQVNPGETIELGVTLKNYGISTTATNVSARLWSSDSYVTVTDSIKTYGNISPGATAATAPYIFNVSQSVRNGHTLKFGLEISSDQGTWSGTIWITAMAPDLDHQSNEVLDGNGILEPGETADFLVWIGNIGGLEGTNVSGILRSANSGLIVTDSMGYFGNIPVSDSAVNSANPFTLSADPLLTPGTSVRFSLILSGNNGFVDTTGFRLTVGIVDSTEPLGPDDHGYYAYDDTDTGFSEAPVYEWIEIDPRPPHNGSGDTISLGADQTKTIALPFSFKFYGNWYNRVSICSNGYIAMDSTWIADMYNWHIPAAGGPPLLISPFWDDLDPNITDSSGVICYWHDAANHRFVIEYSRIQHIHDYVNPTPAELQTFEVVLYDPQYYTTQTGDGEITFQYLDITNDDVWHNYATVGIENYDHTTGIEYTYANIYPAAAAPLANGRAIKFTTDPPDPFTALSELKTGVDGRRLLQASPNPFRERLNIRYRIHDTGYTICNTKLAIYDISGRVVKSFNLESSIMDHESNLSWDRTDDSGRRVSQGIYFIMLEGEHFSITEKVIIVD